MEKISKNNLKGKYVAFIDRDCKFRVNKVVKIVGRFLTVKDVFNRKKRINLDNVLGRQLKKKLQPISS